MNTLDSSKMLKNSILFSLVRVAFFRSKPAHDKIKQSQNITHQLIDMKLT